MINLGTFLVYYLVVVLSLIIKFINKVMGNYKSQFEQQFNDMYKFVQIVEDPYFGNIKVYRKNFLNYDYMMVIDLKINDLDQEMSVLERKFSAIMKYQDGTTLRLFHHVLLQESQIQCRGTILRIFSQYQNNLLHDYLGALRVRQIPLLLIELIYILKTVTAGILTLYNIEMGIKNINLNSRKIFVTPTEGQVMLSPVYCLCQSVQGIRDKNNINSLTQDNSKYSLNLLDYKQSGGFGICRSTLRIRSKVEKKKNSRDNTKQRNQNQQNSLERNSNQIKKLNSGSYFSKQSFYSMNSDKSPWFHLKQNIRNLFLEMTEYISRKSMQKSNQIYEIIENSNNLQVLHEQLPQNQTQNLFVDQVYSCNEINGRVYGIAQ